MGAKRCIELGVYTGYSSLSVALALPPDGLLVACERVPHTFAVAQRFYEKAGVRHKVDPRLGLAKDTLQQLLEEGQAGSFDFAFLDADKRMYREYYELLLTLLRPGGLLVVDNVLWHGQLADPQVTDRKTEYLRAFNKFIRDDPRIHHSIVPVGDGVALLTALPFLPWDSLRRARLPRQDRPLSSDAAILAAIVPSAQDAEVVTSGENDKGARPAGATARAAEKEGIEERGSVEGTVTMAAKEVREGGEGREHGEGVDGAGGGAERDDLRAKRRNRRAEKKTRKAQSTESTGSIESTESLPRHVSEWRTRPLVPHGASQWPQIQSLAATSAGASLSIDAIFAALGLPPLADGHPLLPVRVRQHVNPLKTSLMAPPPPVDWAEVYEDPSLPLVVDIGSASGRLVLALAVRDWKWREQQRGGEGWGKEEREKADASDAKVGAPPSASSTSSAPPPLPPSFLPSPPLNFLGFEIRDKLVQRTDTWRRQLALRNAHFVVANATSALESVLATYPGPLVAVSILCPDPHFKKKHRKRRVVQQGLVEAIGRVMVPGGHVFVESDVEEVAADMYRQFADDLVAAGGAGEGEEGEEIVWQERAGVGCAGEGSAGEGSAGDGSALEGSAGEAIRWLGHNPLGMPSEREVVVLLQGSPMYRALFVKQ
ncbi:unnamed protein product [Closterium sp. Yama58-4]|nr:unnamed protein product [Closterium sp. Yama58-4]